MFQRAGDIRTNPYQGSNPDLAREVIVRPQAERGKERIEFRVAQAWCRAWATKSRTARRAGKPAASTAMTTAKTQEPRTKRPSI